MADTYTLARAVIDLLKAVAPDDVTVCDSEPEHTPAGRYVVVTDTAGHATPDRIAAVGGSRDMRWVLTCKSVAHAPDGVRRLSGWLRATLTDHWPTPGPSTSPLQEIGASPLLAGGPLGDRRHSQTLIWATYTDPLQED